MTEATPAPAAPEVVAGATAPAAASPSPAAEPVVAPAADSAPAAPVVAETPKADEPAKSAEAAPVVEAKPDAPKTEDAPKVDGEAKPEGEVEPPKVEAPKYEFKMPEGVVAEAPIMSAYSNILTKYNMTPEAGQELLDFHGEQIKATAARIEQGQQDAFAETRRGWVKDFEKQAGNRRDTMLNDAKWAAGQFAGDKKQAAELWNVLNFTGAGDHPAVIRTFSNIAKALRERSAPQHGNPSNSAPSDPVTRRYGPAKRA
jgi:hypothetical protein